MMMDPLKALEEKVAEIEAKVKLAVEIKLIYARPSAGNCPGC